MEYPAFTDMYGLLDRGDVILSGTQIALALQTAHPGLAPHLKAISMDPWKKLIRMLVYMHSWFHGAVEDRRKVVKWLKAHDIIPLGNELRTFVLSTLAFGIAASHRELGTVSQVKLDLIVANIMAVSLQFDECSPENYMLMPRTLNEVENYLRRRLNLDNDELNNLFDRSTEHYPVIKTSYTTLALLSVSKSIARSCLYRVSNEYDSLKKKSWLDGSTYVMAMRLAQPILAPLHEQLCPRSLTFDGILDGFCVHEPMLRQICIDTKVEIFGGEKQRQDCMLDSFIPATMTRDECGFPATSLLQSVYNQVTCAMLRGQLAELKAHGQVPQHLAIIVCLTNTDGRKQTICARQAFRECGYGIHTWCPPADADIPVVFRDRNQQSNSLGNVVRQFQARP
jgi:hypothetical protein